MSRQARANEVAFETIYKEQEQKWTKENKRWENMTKDEIAYDARQMLKITDINSIKDKEERHWASIVHAMNDTYKSMGYSNSENQVVELIKRIKK